MYYTKEAYGGGDSQGVWVQSGGKWVILHETMNACGDQYVTVSFYTVATENGIELVFYWYGWTGSEEFFYSVTTGEQFWIKDVVIKKVEKDYDYKLESIPYQDGLKLNIPASGCNVGDAVTVTMKIRSVFFTNSIYGGEAYHGVGLFTADQKRAVSRETMNTCGEGYITVSFDTVVTENGIELVFYWYGWNGFAEFNYSVAAGEQFWIKDVAITK